MHPSPSARIRSAFPEFPCGERGYMHRPPVPLPLQEFRCRRNASEVIDQHAGVDDDARQKATLLASPSARLKCRDRFPTEGCDLVIRHIAPAARARTDAAGPAEVTLHDLAERIPGVNLQGRQDLVGLLVEGNRLHAFVQWTHDYLNLMTSTFARERPPRGRIVDVSRIPLNGTSSICTRPQLGVSSMRGPGFEPGNPFGKGS